MALSVFWLHADKDSPSYGRRRTLPMKPLQKKAAAALAAVDRRQSPEKTDPSAMYSAWKWVPLSYWLVQGEIAKIAKNVSEEGTAWSHVCYFLLSWRRWNVLAYAIRKSTGRRRPFKWYFLAVSIDSDWVKNRFFWRIDSWRASSRKKTPTTIWDDDKRWRRGRRTDNGPDPEDIPLYVHDLQTHIQRT